MMRSLYSGVSGLKTHQTKMDVIGNNIANVNTVAYKSSSITFGELMYQTVQNASGANAATGTGGVNAKQIGLGVSAGAINTSIATAGATQTTGNPFDLKITGDSFFVVSNGQNNYFTRAGAFYVDGAGNLAMTSNGYNVMGWQVDETGMAIKKDTVSALKIMSASNMTYPPEATSKAYISGIIDRYDSNVTSISGKTMNLTFYDNLGYSYTAKLSMKQIGDSTEGNYSLELMDVLDSTNKSVMGRFDNISLGSLQTVSDPKTLSIVNGYSIGEDADGDRCFVYKDSNGNDVSTKLTALDATSKDAEGNLIADKLAAAYGYEGKTNEFLKLTVYTDGSTTPPATKTMAQVLASGIDDDIADLMFGTAGSGESLNAAGREFTGATISYDTDNGLFKSINGSPTLTSLTLNLNSNGTNGNFSDISIDLSDSSMLDHKGVSTLAPTSGDQDGYGTGRRLGQLSGISIQTNGMIYASYDNGQTRLLGQIAVAEFANASGLEKVGENLYQATLNSGEFDGIGVDVTASSGSMTTGVLEMSNVDLSSEFTEMITTQRGFQANSRIITVSDTLLEELTNLKR